MCHRKDHLTTFHKMMALSGGWIDATVNSIQILLQPFREAPEVCERPVFDERQFNQTLCFIFELGVRIAYNRDQVCQDLN